MKLSLAEDFFSLNTWSAKIVTTIFHINDLINLKWSICGKNGTKFRSQCFTEGLKRCHDILSEY